MTSVKPSHHKSLLGVKMLYSELLKTKILPTAFILISLILTNTCPINQALATSLNLTNVRLIDGTGSAPQNNMNIVIYQGKIASISPTFQKNGLPTLDLKGKTVLPGLIDSHVHIKAIPGTIYRNDSNDKRLELVKQNLRAYLAAGVTTVLDCAATKSSIRSVRQWKRQRFPAPTYLALNPFLTPKNGYFGDSHQRGPGFSDMTPPIENPEMIEQAISEGSMLSASGVKVTAESGLGPFKVWPVFDDAQIQKIKSSAANHQLPLYVHSMSNAEHELALKFEPHALVHSGYYDESPDPKVINKIKNAKSYVISTLGMYKMFHLMWEPKELDSDFFKRLVPKLLLDTAKDPDARKAAVKKVSTVSSPSWLPSFLAGLLGKFMMSGEDQLKFYNNTKVGITALHKAGVPIVMGSDSGNYPEFTTVFHGVSSIIEMESLVDAGLSEMDAIVAATSRPAKMLGIDNERGTVEVGKFADLIILNGDPLKNISELRQIEWTIKEGLAFKPEQWLTSAIF